MFGGQENAKKHRADAKTTYDIKSGFDVQTIWSSALNQLQSSSYDCTYSGKPPSRRDHTKRVMSNSSSIIIDQNLNWGTVCDR